MIARARLADALAFLCHYGGVSSLFFYLNRHRKKIVTYHNVLPDDHVRGLLHEGVSHRLSVFRRQIDYLARHFTCDSRLADASSVTITFDDGYLNLYTLAQPVLEKAGIRAYFFIPLTMLETGQTLAIDRLLLWVSVVPPGTFELRLESHAPRVVLSIGNDADRLAVWQQLFGLLETGSIEAGDLVERLEECVAFETIQASIGPDYYRLRFVPIPVDGIAEMKARGHLVGPHSSSHRILSTLSTPELEADIAACAESQHFNCRVFSYPFGGIAEVSSRVVDCVSASGFEYAVSNINEPLTRERVYSKHFLPRMSLPDTETVYLLSFVLSGAKYFFQHGRLLPQWT
jgi:peptidoglycan/xylan/chitin deacetylase (PgdA/CDA1 family)